MPEPFEYRKLKEQGWVCVGEAIKELDALDKGVSRQTLHNWRKAGKVETRHILDGKREYYLFRRDELGLPPKEQMPSEALSTLQALDVQIGPAAETVTELLLEKLEPVLQHHTADMSECFRVESAKQLELLTSLTSDVKRLADSQERIAAALERQEEREAKRRGFLAWLTGG